MCSARHSCLPGSEKRARDLSSSSHSTTTLNMATSANRDEKNTPDCGMLQYPPGLLTLGKELADHAQKIEGAVGLCEIAGSPGILGFLVVAAQGEGGDDEN